MSHDRMPATDHLQPAHLLVQAEQLVHAGADPGQPRQVDLRRAVSTAYYAVYHDITLRSASQLIGHEPSHIHSPVGAVLHLVRWFTHGGLSHATRLTEDLAGDATAATWKPARRAAWELLHDRHPTPLPRHLLRTTEHARWLQEQRHVADYDHAVSLSRTRAIAVVRVAGQALEVLQRHANDAPFRGFFALVALCAPRPVGV